MDGQRIPSSHPRVEMIVASIVILVVMLTLSFITLLAFSQAAAGGQFDDPEGAARSIFDADEPIGQPTDMFLIHHENT